MLLVGSGSQQETGEARPRAQLAGRMADEGWMRSQVILAAAQTPVSAAKGQLQVAHGQMRKCRQCQY